MCTLHMLWSSTDHTVLYREPCQLDLRINNCVGGNEETIQKDNTNIYQLMLSKSRLVYPDYEVKQINLVMDMIAGYQSTLERCIEKLLNPACVQCWLLMVQTSMI